jgi:hypothetical protein
VATKVLGKDMKQQLFRSLFAVLILVLPATAAENRHTREAGNELTNETFHLIVTIATDGTVNVRLDDLHSGLRVADGPCLYRASGDVHGTAVRSDRLEEAVVKAQNRSLVIRGNLLGQELTHTFTLPKDKPLLRPSGRNQHLPRVRCVPGPGGGKE